MVRRFASPSLLVTRGFKRVLAGTKAWEMEGVRRARGLDCGRHLGYGEQLRVMLKTGCTISCPFSLLVSVTAALESSRLVLPAKGDELNFGGCSAQSVHQEELRCTKVHAHLAVTHTACQCWKSSMDLS